MLQRKREMQHFARVAGVRKSLAQAVAKISCEIEEIHARGRSPTDYSLGFANGLIFCDHQLGLKDGEPRFFNRTTSVGNLPRPIALDSDDFEKMIAAKDALSDAERAELEGYRVEASAYTGNEIVRMGDRGQVKP